MSSDTDNDKHMNPRAHKGMSYEVHRGSGPSAGVPEPSEKTREDRTSEQKMPANHDQDVAEQFIEQLEKDWWEGVRKRASCPSEDDPLGPKTVEQNGLISVRYVEADQARHAPQLFQLLYSDLDTSEVLKSYDEMTAIFKRAQKLLST